MLKIYNTLSRSVEEFVSLQPSFVGMYSCGPTVYDYQHIGHMRRYTMDDILVRVLKAQGYTVKHVMNITDVGHLVSDEDTGEDKMEKGARKFGVSVWEVAKRFEEQFWDSILVIGIQKPDEVMHATDYIQEQIGLIKILEGKGYTYKISDGIYFDTSKFPDYFKLSRQNPEELKKGARVEFVEGKKNAADFALWKFSYPEGVSFDEIATLPRNDEGKIEKRQMEWESPWGVGFPGWHIECSAMSLQGLFQAFEPSTTFRQERIRTIDIHTGGIDHIAIHHSNEIAQSECATGEKFVNYWVHHNFLVVEGEKMSKSLGNFYTVQDVVDRGYDPLSLRYLYLQTHYRQEMNFTWEALEGAQSALQRLRSVILGSETKDLDSSPLAQNDKDEIASNSSSSRNDGVPNIVWMKKFMDALTEDLNTAKALAVMWEIVKDEDLQPGEKKGTLLEMDRILGLGLDKKEKVEVPEEVVELIKEREIFRKAGDWGASDELREKILDLGFEIKDTKEGPQISKK